MDRGALRRRRPIRRKSRLRPANPRRKHRRYEEQFGAYADIIRALPCAACSDPPPSDPHHTRSRGAGGTKRHLVPLCRWCHATGHALGWSRVEDLYGVDLDQVAAKLWGVHGDTASKSV